MVQKQTKIQMEPENSYKINRTYKDSLFRMIFKERDDLLDLYNAVNGSDYKDPGELISYTIENAIYISMKNDISFLVGDMLSLYEHQSTVNPNMPMRGLLYLARNYEAYIERNRLDIYSSVLQRFPLPQYFIFYNGQQDEPDMHPLELIDAFPKVEGKEPCINCKATLLNINYGHNAELLKKCRKLEEYATLVHRIKENVHFGMETKEAIDFAIDSCIEDDILRDFLLKHRGEVRNVVLTSFDQENHDRILKEEYTRQGEMIGEERGIAIGEERGIAIGEERGIAIGEERGIAIGEERGIAIGEEQGESRTKRIFKLHAAGKTQEEIAAECNVSVEKVIQILV